MKIMINSKEKFKEDLNMLHGDISVWDDDLIELQKTLDKLRDNFSWLDGDNGDVLNEAINTIKLLVMKYGDDTYAFGYDVGEKDVTGEGWPN